LPEPWTTCSKYFFSDAAPYYTADRSPRTGDSTIRWLGGLHRADPHSRQVTKTGFSTIRWLGELPLLTHTADRSPRTGYSTIRRVGNAAALQ